MGYYAKKLFRCTTAFAIPGFLGMVLSGCGLLGSASVTPVIKRGAAIGVLESPDDVARVAALVPQDNSYANRTTYNSLIVAGRCISGSFAVSAKVATTAISLVMACADDDGYFSGSLDLSSAADGPVLIDIGFLKSTISTNPIFVIKRVVTKDTESPSTFTIPSSLTEVNKALAFPEVEGAILYNVTFTPVGGGAAIGPISVTTPSVPVSSLTIGTTYTVSIVALDGAGNETSAANTATFLKTDTDPPVFNSMALTNEALGGYIGASEKNATSHLVDPMTGSGYETVRYAVGLSSVACSAMTTYGSSIPYPADMVGGDGNYKVCVELQDDAANITYGMSAVIRRDTVPPVVTLTSSSPVSPANSLRPRIIGSVDSVSTVTLYSDSFCSVQISLGGANSALASPGVLVNVDVTANDTTSIYASAVDLAENTSACTGTAFSYAHDNLAPTSTNISINSAAAYTTSTAATATVAATGATHMYITNTAGCASGGTYETYATTKSWTLGQTNATATVYIKFKDAAGNESACINDTIIHDNTAPTISSPSVATTSPGTSLTPTMSFTLSAAATVTLYNSNLCTTAISSATAMTSGVRTMTTNTLTANATTTIFVKAVDTATNSSTCTSIGSYINETFVDPPATTTGGTTATTTGGTTGGPAEVHLAYLNTGYVNVGYLHGTPGGTLIDDPAFAALDSGYNLFGAALTLDSSDLPWISFTGKNGSSLQSNVATSVTITGGFSFNGTAFQGTPIGFSGDSAIAIRSSPFDVVAMMGWNADVTTLSHRFNSITDVNSGFAVSSTELAQTTVPDLTPSLGYSAATDSADKIHLIATVKGISGYDKVEYRTYDGSTWSAALTAAGRLNKSDDYAGTSCLSSNMPGIAFDRVNTGEGVHLVYYCSQSVDEIMHLWWDGDFWHYEGILLNVNMMVPAVNQNSRLGFAIYNGIAHLAYWDSSGNLRHSKGTKTHVSSAAGYTVSGTSGNYTITATVESGSHYFTEGQTVLISNDTNSVLNGSVQIQRIDDQNFSFVSATDPGAAGEFTVPIWKYIWSTPDLVDSIAGGGTFHTPQVAIDSTGYARIAYVHQTPVNVSDTKSDIRLWHENSGGTSPDTVTVLTYTHATNKIFLGYGLGITGSTISVDPPTSGTTTTSGTTGETTTTSGTTGETTTTGGTTTTSGTTGGVTCTVGQDPVGFFACCKFGSQCVDLGIQWSCPDVGYIVGLMAGNVKCFPDTAGFNACNATSVSTSTGGGSSGSTSTTTGTETAGSTTTSGTECVTNGLAAEFAASCMIDDQGALSCPSGRQFYCSDPSDIVGSLNGDPTCFASEAMATICGTTVIDEGTSTGGSSGGTTAATSSSSTTATGDTTTSTTGVTTTSTTGVTTTSTTGTSSSGGTPSTCRSWTISYNGATLSLTVDLGQATFDALNTDTTWTYDGAFLHYTTPTGPVAIDVATQLLNAGGSTNDLGSGSGMGGSLTVVSTYAACPGPAPTFTPASPSMSPLPTPTPTPTPSSSTPP